MASDSRDGVSNVSSSAHSGLDLSTTDSHQYQPSGPAQPAGHSDMDGHDQLSKSIPSSTETVGGGYYNHPDHGLPASGRGSNDSYQHASPANLALEPDGGRTDFYQDSEPAHLTVESDSSGYHQQSGLAYSVDAGNDGYYQVPTDQAVKPDSGESHHHTGHTQPSTASGRDTSYQRSDLTQPLDQSDSGDFYGHPDSTGESGHSGYYHQPSSNHPQFDIDYLYHRAVRNAPYHNLTDSEEDDPLESRGDVYGIGSTQQQYHSYGSNMGAGGVHPRLVQTQSSEEEDDAGRKPKTVAVDPGSFRYNKRVFVTALPCLLLTLIMTGETLLLIVTVGSMVTALMAQIGEDVSKRCVVVFALLFIPCHILVVGTVLPLLWLSVWNLLLLAIVNLFCVLTGGWIIIQFTAFRKEEPAMCITIEQLLFSLYPLVCCALVTWVMSTVISLAIIPFIFTFLWFVCLQLYLMPAVSSFKQTNVKQTEEEGQDVLPQPILITIIAAFVLSGSALHAVLTVVGSSLAGLFSLPSLALLGMLLCLGVFLSTLLSLRQVSEYLGWSHQRTVQARWGSGVGVVLLCYPVLQQLGMVSHFLLSLPIAVVGFAALGLVLSCKKGKVLAVMLMAVLVGLLCLLLYQLPWSLTYSFLDVVPMKSFYMLVGANFMLCLLAIYAAWFSSKEVFGSLLLLQCVGLTVCETGLYQAKLYSLPTFQLTGVVSAYTLHRLYIANKLSRTMATLCSAVQLTKTVKGTLGYLQQPGGREQGEAVVEISALDFLTLLLFVGVLVWLFLYETKEEVTLLQCGQHLTLLMVSLAVSSQSFLLPVGVFMLQDDITLSDLVGLWYGLGAVLVVLYALQHNQSAGILDQLTKVAMVMGGVGALVMVMQPHFDLTLYALFQWSEVFSILLIAALLVTGVEVGFSQTLVTAAILGVCPGIHATMLLYGEIPTIVHFVLLAMLSGTLLAFLLMVIKMQEVSETAENFIPVGALAAASLLVGVLAVDLINYEYIDTVWDYPAWTVALVGTAFISLSLKALAIKLGPQHLPLTKEDNSGLPLIPLIGNVATFLAFLLARTQGPFDVLLHDLWCCGAALFLILLQRDSLLLSSLSPSNRATPTIMAAVGTLVFSTVVQSRLWSFDGMGSALLGLMEILVVLASLPVYVVLAGIMWRGEIWSEKAVVFTMPLNAFVFLLGTSYTSWALSVAGFVSGVGMMMLKLPLLPNNFEMTQR